MTERYARSKDEQWLVSTMAVMRGLLPLAALVAFTACAQSLEQAAARLAARVARAEPVATANIAVENRTSLPAAAVERVRAIVTRELRRAQRSPDGTASARFTIAENAAGPLIVAEVQNGDTPAVLIERFDRPERVENTYAASLHLRSIRTQPAPILDFAFLGDTLAVLEPGQIVLYRHEQATALPITPAAPLPRDARGRLAAKPPLLEAHLPGTVCTATLESPAGADCKTEDAHWREAGLEVAWVPRRNTLTSPSVEQSPFYSAAALPGDRAVFATLAGTLSVAPGQKFGSDIAGLTAACASALVLVTGRATDSDMVQAMDLSGPEPRAITDQVALPGSVVALWTAEVPGEVSLVVRNAKTGEYEASRASVACDR